MRTKNLFRSIVAATLAVVSTSAFAQLTTTGSATVDKGTPYAYTSPTSGANPEVVDFVTVGSTMPYSVVPDSTIQTIVASGAPFQASSYNWRLGTTPLGSLRQADGSTALANIATDPAPYNAGYYLDYDVAVIWGNTPGIDSIKVSEHSRNNGGLQTCDGADTTLYVYVMPKPTAQFIEAGTLAGATNIVGTANDAIVGGCGIAGSTLHFNVTFTGTQDFYVYYSSVYTPFGGLAAPAVTGSVTTGLGAANFYTATPTVPNTDAVTDAFTFAIPAATYGKYVFTLTGVNDLVSRKSLTAADMGTLVNTTGSAPAGPTLTVYSLPTPTTGRVLHVTNQGW